tara:strand:+ start:2641 stop:3027 length:387 start_codon:yes stop_codon:yes gene_type:complete
MAHYAFLDENNIVTEVIPGVNEDTKDDLPDGFDSWEAWYGNFRGQTCKRTSYNTYGNEHKLGGTPFRGNYAGINYIYDESNDVFYLPKPYDSWVLNTSTWIWEAPVDYPDDGKFYVWNEDNTSWDEVE